MGWGNISTLGFSLAGAIAAKLAFPNRQVVNVAGDAAIGYMLGNIEVPLRHNLGITTIHINNSGFTELGPGFWGPGMAPYTHAVTRSDRNNLAKVVEGMGIYAERVTAPSEIVPAIQRALEENSKKRPAYLEFISSQYPVYGAWIGGGKGKGPSRS